MEDLNIDLILCSSDHQERDLDCKFVSVVSEA